MFKLLETIVKNCGDMVHMHVAEKGVIHEMVRIVKKKPDFHVKETILVLTDTWQEASGGPRARYPQNYAGYQELLRAGAVFPQISERSAPVFTPPQTQPLTSYPPNLRIAGPGNDVPEPSAEPEFPRYHFDGTPRKFCEGWYFRVSIPEKRESFCFMYSVENPAFRQSLSPLEVALYGPRFTGVGAQILGANDKYCMPICTRVSQLLGRST